MNILLLHIVPLGYDDWISGQLIDNKAKGVTANASWFTEGIDFSSASVDSKILL